MDGIDSLHVSGYGNNTVRMLLRLRATHCCCIPKFCIRIANSSSSVIHAGALSTRCAVGRCSSLGPPGFAVLLSCLVCAGPGEPRNRRMGTDCKRHRIIFNWQRLWGGGVFWADSILEDLPGAVSCPTSGSAAISASDCRCSGCRCFFGRRADICRTYLRSSFKGHSTRLGSISTALHVNCTKRDRRRSLLI